MQEEVSEIPNTDEEDESSFDDGRLIDESEPYEQLVEEEENKIDEKLTKFIQDIVLGDSPTFSGLENTARTINYLKTALEYISVHDDENFSKMRKHFEEQDKKIKEEVTINEK